MPKTDTRIARERPTDEIIAQQRARIAGAREHHKLSKENIERGRAEAIAQADEEFATVIREARRLRVPWKDIEGASGLKKQTIHPMIGGDA